MLSFQLDYVDYEYPVGQHTEGKYLVIYLNSYSNKVNKSL